MKELHPAPSMAHPMGQVLLGRYRIVRELAKGGMGVVYLARSEGAVGFVKPVVVKLVLPEHATDHRFRSMFVREAQILANLRHPGIVDVIELGEENSAYVMVLEYVRGYHLGQWSKYLRLKQRQLPPDIAIQIMMDVLDALHHAHAMSHPDGTSMHIVHRDVSPSNILLDEDGRARLLDFGVARMRGGNAEYMTQVKGFVGKLIYSAPEVFAEGGDATPSSDAYACAVVLHEVLLGRNCFRAESQGQSLHRVLHLTPEALEPLRSDVPAGLDAVLSKALAKDPEARFASARDFALALGSLQQEPESELRSKLAAMLKGDFGREMSELLGLESLADRDEAWRRLSHRPPDNDPERLAAADAVLAEFYPTNISTTGSSGEQMEPAFPKPSQPPTAGPTALPTSAPRRATTSRGFRASAIPPPPPPSARSVQAAVPTMRVSEPTRFDHRSGLIVIAALALGAVASYGWIARERVQTPQSVVVVQEDSAPPAKAVPNTDPLQAADAAASDPEQDPGSTARDTPRRGRRKEHPTSARALSAALSAQRGRIESCFKAHTVSVQGVANLSLSFTIDAKGKVEQANLTPPALAATELGQCLARVGKATVFPATGRPLSFSIPLSAKAR